MTDGSRPPREPAYDLLLELERLESVREEMHELGASTAAELASLSSAEAAEALEELRALGVGSLAEVEARIDELHRQLDTLEE